MCCCVGIGADGKGSLMSNKPPSKKLCHNQASLSISEQKVSSLVDPAVSSLRPFQQNMSSPPYVHNISSSHTGLAPIPTAAHSTPTPSIFNTHQTCGPRSSTRAPSLLNSSFPHRQNGLPSSFPSSSSSTQQDETMTAKPAKVHAPSSIFSLPPSSRTPPGETERKCNTSSFANGNRQHESSDMCDSTEGSSSSRSSRESGSPLSLTSAPKHAGSCPADGMCGCPTKKLRVSEPHHLQVMYCGDITGTL